MQKFLLRAVSVACLLVSGPAVAEMVVKTIGIADERAVLLRPEDPKASVILMPGGNGHVDIGHDGVIHNMRNDLLVRTRFAYAERGRAVLVIDAGVDLKLAIDVMRRVKSPVTVIAASRGTLRAARGVAEGAQPDALVLISGILTGASGRSPNVAEILGTPTWLPPTLVIHHRQDTCAIAMPAGVAAFLRWADGRARAVWFDGGHGGGRPCDVGAYHGFAGLDTRVVSASARFR
jgi:hypothetical protein